MFGIIRRPLVTEKTSSMAEHGVFVFEVDRKADKAEIKRAVEKFFRVKVKDVRTANCRGRARRTRFGMTKVSYWKRAMVTLAPGEKIALFEGV